MILEESKRQFCAEPIVLREKLKIEASKRSRKKESIPSNLRFLFFLFAVFEQFFSFFQKSVRECGGWRGKDKPYYHQTGSNGVQPAEPVKNFRL